jgi:hypothetical protein
MRPNYSQLFSRVSSGTRRRELQIAPGGEGEARHESEEGLMLVGAGGAETGADLFEGGIRIAGVADEFVDHICICDGDIGGAGRRRGGLRLRSSIGQGGEEGAEGGGDIVEAGGPGSKDTDGALGGGDSGGTDETLKGSTLRGEGNDGEAAEARGMRRGAEGPGRLKGITDRGDLAGVGGAEQRGEDTGEEVGVLMRVDVGDAEAGSLEAADLGGGFGFDFGGADAAGMEIKGEAGEAGSELAAGRHEGGDLVRGKNRCGVDEEDVAAGFEGGMGMGGGDGIVKEGSGGHESGGGERAGLVEFGDRAVDAGGEAEVVGINQEGHERQGTRYRAEPSAAVEERGKARSTAKASAKATANTAARGDARLPWTTLMPRSGYGRQTRGVQNLRHGAPDQLSP